MSHYTMLCKCGKRGRVILRGRFNETIFLLAFVGSGTILANYALRASLAIYHLIYNTHSLGLAHLISNKREWNNRFV